MGATVYLQAISTSNDIAAWRFDTSFGYCQDERQKSSAQHRQALAENSVFNLIRYSPSGNYFARLRVNGKLIRKELIRKESSLTAGGLCLLCRYRP